MAGTLFEQEQRTNLVPYLTDGDLYFLKDLRAQYLQMPPLADMATNENSVRSRILQLNNWYGKIDQYFESIEYGTRRAEFQKYIDYDKSEQAKTRNDSIKTMFRIKDDGSFDRTSLPERLTGARQWFMNNLNAQDTNLRYEMLKAIELNQNDDAFISHEFVKSTAIAIAVIATVYVGGVAGGAWGGAGGAATSPAVGGAAAAGGAGAGAAEGAVVVGSATPAGGILGGTGLLTGESAVVGGGLTLGEGAAAGGAAGGSGLFSGLTGIFSEGGALAGAAGYAESAIGAVASGYVKDALNPGKNVPIASAEENSSLTDSQKTKTALVIGLGLLGALFFS